MELPPELDEPGAAIPESGVGLGDVKGVGLDTAPINESDVVGTVVVVDVFAGATAFDAVGVWEVESLLTLCVVIFSTGAIGALRVVGVVEEEVVPSNWAEPSGDDFRMSLCGLRMEDDSLVVECVLAVLLSDSWAFS